MEAMENGKEELKEKMMDQMLEEFDRLEKTKADTQCLEGGKYGKRRGHGSK